MADGEMPGVPSSIAHRARFPLLLLSVLLLVFGTNLQGVALPLIGHERGSPMLAIGLFSAGWSAGFVLACLTLGGLLRRLGPRQVFVALAALSATCGAALAFAGPDGAVIALRIATGFSFGALTSLLEGWLVEGGGSGGAFGIYVATNLLASVAGTLSLLALDPRRPGTLLLAAVAVALSAAPMLLAGRPRASAPGGIARPRLLLLARAAPEAMLAALAAGLVTGAIGGLGPVAGMMAGLDMRGITGSLAANSVGGALATAPVALLAARFGPRRMLGISAVLGAVVAAPAAFATTALGPAGLVATFALLGLFQYPLYALASALLNATGRPPVEVATATLLVFGLGTVAGPLAAGEVLKGGAGGLFGFVAPVMGVAALAVGAASLRRARRQPPGPR